MHLAASPPCSSPPCRIAPSPIKIGLIGGQLRNVEFDKVENLKDPVKARMKTN
jgi:hypothetical protein